MRLPGYDYSEAGGYFITICTNNRTCIFSRVHGGSEQKRARLELTGLGLIVQDVLNELAEKYGVKISACAIMPNHIHLILMMNGSGVTAGRFVGAFKSVVSNRWQKICDSRGIAMGKLWQRDFYDHILRNEADYLEKLKYIDENPDKWQQDELFCDKMYGLRVGATLAVARAEESFGFAKADAKTYKTPPGDRKGRPYAEEN